MTEETVEAVDVNFLGDADPNVVNMLNRFRATRVQYVNQIGELFLKTQQVKDAIDRLETQSARLLADEAKRLGIAEDVQFNIDPRTNKVVRAGRSVIVPEKT